MPRSRVQSNERKTSSTARKKVKKVSSVVSSKQKKVASDSSLGDVKRFVGLSLGGGKADKACLAVIEYYPKHRKIFLTKIYEKIKSDDDYSADSKILDILEENKKNLQTVAFDVPLNPPQCFVSDKCCGRIEKCKEPHVKWMWDYMQALHKKRSLGNYLLLILNGA